MKGVDLSNYALEDLLAFDDIFLDYFNNFLKNPAFPQQIQYNRYLGLFEEINPIYSSIIVIDRLPKRIINRQTTLFQPAPSSSASSSSSDGQQTPNLNETEQNKVFDWVRQERLPLFFRTDFFREFKLCKLLSRSLDDQRSDSQTSSQLIGGYSRQSPPISNTLSTDDQEGSTTVAGGGFGYASGSNLNESRTTANKNDFEIDFENSINNIDLPLLEKFNRVLFQRPGSRALSVPSYFPFASVNFSASSNLFNNETKKSSIIIKSVKNSAKSSRIKTAQLKKQENLTDLTKIDDITQTSNKANKSLRSDDKKAIGFLIKKDSIENSKKANLKFSQFAKQHDGNEFTAVYANRDDDLNTDEDDDEDDQEDEDEDDDAEDGKNNYQSYEYFNSNNNNLKLDENLSFVEDDYETIEDFVENGKVHASINQYKQKFLGSVAGMNEFKEFLKYTSGNYLIKFWLDCEFYRDSMQDYDQIENMATRNRLFSLDHKIFDSIQYDILRRIRAYWVPRFILNKLKQLKKDYGAFPLPPLTPEYSRQSTYISVPSTGKSISYGSREDKNEELNADQKSILYAKVKQALHSDKEAGGPFLRYISGSTAENLPLILFWYDVCDFNEADAIGFDKNSRLQHAWAIYNSYLSPTARFNIGLPVKVSDEAKKSLQILTNSVRTSSSAEIDSNLFRPVMEKIIPYLQESWIKFIKDDVLKYTQARLEALLLKKEIEETDEDLENKEFIEKIPEPDLVIENNQIFLKRPWIKTFLQSKEGEMDKPKKILTESERAERIRRNRMIERERQKALKMVMLRERAKKLGLSEDEKKEDSLLTASINNIDNLKVEAVVQPEIVQKKKEEEERERQNEKKQKKSKTFQTDRGSFFDKMLSTNKTLMQLYRKSFVDNQQRELLNKFNGFLDSKQYVEINDPIKKAALATSFMKMYLDKNSKKNILPLSERLQNRLNQDMQISSSKDVRSQPRPRSPFLKELIKEFRPDLEDKYQKFCELKAAEYGTGTPEEFALMSQSEIQNLMGDSFNPKNFDFDEQEKGDGKASATKEDRAELLKHLYDWSIGKNAEVFYKFFGHLSEHGKKDGFPFLDKDLLFCVDAIRLKEINGEEVLKQKTQVVIEVYLDSASAPNLQIDVNNDILNKLMKSALKITQGGSLPSDLIPFEEAKVSLFKELLPYWAGFKQAQKNATETPTKLDKQDKQLRERLDDFINMRNSSPSDFKLPPLSPRLRVSTPTTNRKKSSQTIDSSLNIVFSITNGIKYALTSELEKIHPEINTAKKVDRKHSNSQFSIATHSHRS